MNIITKAKLALASLTLLTLSSIVCHALPNESLSDAITEAKNDKKAIAIYFDNPTSDDCLALKWNLIGSNRFAALTHGDLVYLMMQDRGADAKGQRLANDQTLQLENQFHVTTFPTMLLFDYNGKLIDRIEGFNPHEDGNANAYFDRIKAAILNGKAQAAHSQTPAGNNQESGLLLVAKDVAASTHVYDGNVIFAFPDGTKLVSHRTITLTSDPSAIKMDSTDYFEGEQTQYVSKIILTGTTKDGAFYSTDQQCLKTDFKKWLPENIKIVFSPDGSAAQLTSTYENSAGTVVGSGLLKLAH